MPRVGENAVITRDPVYFYVTTHSAMFRGLGNDLLRNAINGVKPAKISSETCKQRSGYSKNVLPYVQYDRHVDEGCHFRISSPFKSVTADQYVPPLPTTLKMTGVTTMVNSGFTRLPHYKVTEDGTNYSEKRSLMKTSYNKSKTGFKDSSFDKMKIVPSKTAFVNDIGEIQSLGDSSDDDRFLKAQRAVGCSKGWSCFRPSSMKDDGYSRSTRLRDPLQFAHSTMVDYRFSNHTASEILRRDALKDLKISHKVCNEGRAGMKKPTGAAKNNPTYVPSHESRDFTTETKDSSRMFPPFVTPFSDKISPSGIMKPSREERVRSMHMPPPTAVHAANHDRASLDKDMRDMAISLLTNDFLNAPDVSIELRAHLIETTLPMMVVALEKLMKEVERRNLLKDTMSSKGEVARAAETGILESQIDRPLESPFNPIYWLGQYLFRNNPRYSTLSETGNSPYIQSMQQIGDHLKARLFELQTNKRARLRAEELARLREDEMVVLVETQKHEEKRALYLELLSSVFKKWTARKWRPHPAFLYKFEIIEGLRSVIQMTAIQSDDSMINKVSSLINAISMSPENAERARTLTEEQPKQLQTRDDEKQKISRGNNSTSPPQTRPSSRSAPKGYLSPECLSKDKWDLETFVDSILHLIESGHSEWSQEDLSLFLQSLSIGIDENGEKLIASFNEILYIPKFNTLELMEQLTTISNASSMASAEAVKRAWKFCLHQLCENFHMDTTDGDKSELTAWMREFCHGPGNIENSIEMQRTPHPKSNTQSSDVTIESDMEKRFAGISALKDGVLGLAIAEVEEEYRSNLRMAVGACGLAAANALMLHLSRAQKDTVDKNNRHAKESEIMGPDDGLIYKFFDLLRDHESPAIELFALQTVIDVAFQKLDGSEGANSIRSALVEMKKISGNVDGGLRISEEHFLHHASQLCAKLDRSNCVSMFTKLSECAGPPSLRIETQTTSVDGDPRETTMNRIEIEQRALSEINKLAKLSSVTIHEVANASLGALADALRSLHPLHVIRGRLAISERGVSNVVAEQGFPILSPQPAHIRFVACTPDLRPGLLNTSMPIDGTGVEARVIGERKCLRIETGDDNSVVAKAEEENAVSPTAVSKFLGVPLLSPTHGQPPIGVIGLNLSGEDDGGFVDPDVAFAETASNAIVAVLDKVEQRLKAIALAESSLKYACHMGNVDVQIYLNEPNDWESPPSFLRIDSYSYETNFTVEIEEGNLSERPKSPNVTAMSEDDPITDLLNQTVTERTMIDFTEVDGRVSVYLPVIDENNHVVAVMCVKVHSDQMGEVPQEDLEEIQKITKVLGNAIHVIQEEHIGSPSAIGDLEAERIDDEARRKLLFPKMMLLTARDLLGKLDNRALAEMRSYKKPPVTVHRVLKAVLYVFGKQPKEVKIWSEVSKMVNADLLKAMIEYDPTTIQKKIKFKRCNRVLKLIPYGEVKQRGSLPCQYMHDWLLISLDLRRAAVEARNRKPELYSQAIVSEPGENDDTEDLDEED